MKRFLLPLLTLIAIVIGSFVFLIYGPQTLTPPPEWPFTEQSRKAYDPFGEHSQRTVKTYVSDMKAGRIKP